MLLQGIDGVEIDREAPWSSIAALVFGGPIELRL